MPIIQKELRQLRDAILATADDLNIELSEECKGDATHCKEYAFLGPDNTGLVETRSLMKNVVEACEAKGVKLTFTISIYELPLNDEDRILEVFEQLVGSEWFIVERDDDDRVTDIFCKEPFLPREALELINALDLPLPGNYLHIAIYIEPLEE